MLKKGTMVKVNSQGYYTVRIENQIGEIVGVIESIHQPLYRIYFKQFPQLPDGLNFKPEWVRVVKQNWFQKLFSRQSARDPRQFPGREAVND